MSELNVVTTGRGRDLVLVHGWGMNGRVWDSLVASLATDYRLTVIELPGHGASDYDESLISLNDWSEALLRAAPEHAVWLGWSLGGQLAMNIALLSPERVSALIMLASTPRFIQDKDWPQALSPETFIQFNQKLLANPASTLNAFLALQIRGSEHGRDTLQQLKQAMRKHPLPQSKALVNGLQLLLETDLRASLPDLELPSLWILGSRDMLVPSGLADELHQMLPTAGVHLLDKVAHAPFLSHPDMCNKLLREFLDAN